MVEIPSTFSNVFSWKNNLHFDSNICFPRVQLTIDVHCSIWFLCTQKGYQAPSLHQASMMTSSNGNIFRVAGTLCGEFTGHRWIPSQRPVTRSFDVFFDLRLNKRLSRQSWDWGFETPSRSLWRHCNDHQGPQTLPRANLYFDQYFYRPHWRFCGLYYWGFVVLWANSVSGFDD